MTVTTETGIDREDIPLKSTNNTRRLLCNCSEECLGGSKFINVAFGTLTLIITIALIVQIHYGDYQVEPHGSVATDSIECSEIGTYVLKKGGNSIDAAIASAFCLAVVLPQVTGLESEGEMMIYNHRSRSDPIVINFSGANGVTEELPRLVLGLAFAHQHFGSVAWKDLVQPAANVARRGFLVTRNLIAAIKSGDGKDIFGRLEAGQLLKQETLARTLEIIGNTPETELYKYISKDNQPLLSKATKIDFRTYEIYVPDIPATLLATILQRLREHNFTLSDPRQPEYIYRLAEIVQDVYIQTKASEGFRRCPSTNIAVIDQNEDYVSLVTGMYSVFGSKTKSDGGYLLDVKDRRSVCLRFPVVTVDGGVVCGRRLVFGVRDVALAAQIVSTLLYGSENVTDGVEAPRFAVTLNGTIGIEDGHEPYFTKDVLVYLKSLGKLKILEEPYDSVNIVEKTKDDLNSHSDSRGGGISSRF